MPGAVEEVVDKQILGAGVGEKGIEYPESFKTKMVLQTDGRKCAFCWETVYFIIFCDNKPKWEVKSINLPNNSILALGRKSQAQNYPQFFVSYIFLLPCFVSP